MALRPVLARTANHDFKACLPPEMGLPFQCARLRRLTWRRKSARSASVLGKNGKADLRSMLLKMSRRINSAEPRARTERNRHLRRGMIATLRNAVLTLGRQQNRPYLSPDAVTTISPATSPTCFSPLPNALGSWIPGKFNCSLLAKNTP